MNNQRVPIRTKWFLAPVIVMVPLLCATSLVGASSNEWQLIDAARRGDLPLAKARLYSGVEVDARRSKTGWTALMWAAYWGNVDMVRLLVERGADVNARDRFGTTPLLNAAWSSDSLPIIKLLLAKGADINAKNRYGRTGPHSSGHAPSQRWSRSSYQE